MSDAVSTGQGGDGRALGDLRRSMAEVTRVLYLRRWLFFVPLCLVMSAAFSLSLHVPRRFVCSTTFERRDDPVLVNLPSSEGTAAFVTFRRTLAQDIADPDSLTDVVQRLRLVERRNERRRQMGADAVPVTEERIRQAAQRIANGLEVRFLQTSDHLDVIEVLYTTDDSNTMADVLNGVRDHYIKTTQQRINDVLEQTKAWFESERQKRRAVVEALEDDLIRFRTEHQGLDPLDPRDAVARLAQAGDDLVELQRRHREITTQIEGRREFLRGDATVAPFTSGGGLRISPIERSAESRRLLDSFQRVESEIADLKQSRGMTDRHPDIIELTRKRDRLAADIERQAARETIAISVNGVTEYVPIADPMPVMSDDWRAGRTQAEMELKIFEKLLADNEAEIAQAEATVAEYEDLQHHALLQRKEFSSRAAEVDRARSELALYQGYADQVGRVLAAENSQRGIMFEKIKPASGSAIPASPRLSTVLVLASSIGLATSVALVLLSELFDRTVRTRRQVTSGLGLPILETIGEIVTSAVRRRRIMTRMLLQPAVATVMGTLVLGSASLAYLNLRHHLVYEQVIAVPRSLWHQVVVGTGEAPQVSATGLASPEEQG